MTKTFKLFTLVSFLFVVFPLFMFGQGELQGNSSNNYVDLFENIHADPKEKGFELTWNIPYNKVQELLDKDFSLSLVYETETNAERNKNGDEYTEWQRIDNINLTTTHYAVENLKGGENYVFRLGVNTGQKVYWSDATEITTKKPWNFFNFLVLLGSLAMFLYGMKIMSDGLQQAAGAKLRHLLGSITANPVKGILTGMGITALIQSSSVTTVMTVSFVNAGILTLAQSAGVVMGANIGTTVTAWIIDLLGFKVNIEPYVLVILAIGVPFLFSSKTKWKGWGNVIVGLALLFMGISYLKDAVPNLEPDSALVRFFISVNNIPYFSTIICVLFGTIITVIIQSSAATIALTMTLMATGIIPFEVGAAMVLGENIGTTITALLAATVGNVYAKRTAVIHTLFNIIGVTWVLLLFPYFMKLVVFLTEHLGGGNPISNPSEYGSTGLAMLHSSFNILNVLVLVWFIPQLVKISEKIVKSKGGEDEQFKLDYIGIGYFATPELSLQEAKKEIAKFGEVTSRMSLFARELLIDEKGENRKNLAEKIKKYEEITDKVEVEIVNYLSHITSGSKMDEKLALRIQGMNRIVSNLERIGDLFYQISITLEKKFEEESKFTDKQVQRLLELFDLIDEAFVVMCENLNEQQEKVSLYKVGEVEGKINAKRDEIRQEYFTMMANSSEEEIKGGILYSNIFSSLERVGDHIVNVSEGIKGKT